MRVFSKFIRERNFIHPTAIIEDGVEIGEGNYFGPYCYIKAGTTILDNNRFEAFVIVGTAAEHRDYMRDESSCGVTIGNNNIFREHVTINRGTFRDTQVDNNVTMLRGSHLGHDVIIEDKVTLSCNVLIGGESYIMEGVNMGLGSICHQYSVLGAYSMIGMGGIITKSSRIEPGYVYVGNPVRLLQQNVIGLGRNNIDGSKLMEFDKQYRQLIQKL